MTAGPRRDSDSSTRLRRDSDSSTRVRRDSESSTRRDDLDQRLIDALERLAQGRRALVQSVATRSGLSPLQLDVLSVLARRPRVDPVAGRLAKVLDVAPSTVADAVAALRRKGLVVESADPRDARRRPLRLSAAGREVLAEWAGEHAVFSQALVGIDDSAKATALDVVLQLISRLHGAGVITLDSSCRTCRFHRAEGGPAGYCDLLEQPLLASTLRVDCPEHVPTAG